MFDYIPEFFKAETADTEEEADRWYDDKKNNRRPPELLPRDEVARAINSEIKAGRGSPARRRLPRHRLAPHAGVHPQAAAVDVPPVQGAGRRRHHRGADGGRPDLPLRDGRRRGRPRHRRERPSPGLYAAGECSGGMHGSNRLGGNSLSRPAGLRQARRRGRCRVRRRRLGEHAPAGRRRRQVEGGREARWRRSSAIRHGQREPVHGPAGAAADDERPGRHHPHRARSWSRRSSEIEKSQGARAARSCVEGHRQYNPGWHLAIDLRNMLLVSECIAKAALTREESRGGHTRDDYPGPDAEWGTKNLVLSAQRRRRRCRPGRRSRCRRCRPSWPDAVRGRAADLMAYDLKMRVWRGDAVRRRARSTTPSRSRRARSSSTPSTGSRRPRPATSRSAGTARPASAARAARRSTASRG